MHQHPRVPPVTASPANSPRTNPMRTNNPRDQDRGSSRSDSGRGTPSEQDIGVAEGDTLLRAQENSGQAKENLAKLSQVIQNYHTKAALIILQSRVSLPPAYAKGSEVRRVNKWFNVELDETDAYKESIRTWKNCDVVDNRPPAMMIEIFIDTGELTNTQSLAIVDDNGKRWDVEEALRNAFESTNRGNRCTPKEVILERWHIELGRTIKDFPKDLGTILPRIYKNSIVMFRSLYTYSKVLPTWKLGRRLAKPRSSHSPPKLKYRIINCAQSRDFTEMDTLTIPLYETPDNVVERFVFDPIDSPAGPFSIKVLYRANCDFRIDNPDALLSSHFIGMDEDIFEPSLGKQASRGYQQDAKSKGRRTEIGSLPQTRHCVPDFADQPQAYGSLSTFHNVGPPVSSSPLSALRAARDMTTPSPTASPPLKEPPDHRSAQGSRSSLRSADGAPGMGRRTSVSFMPFKTHSLSASPLQMDPAIISAQRSSIGKSSPLGALTEARRPPSSHSREPSTQLNKSPVLPEPVGLSSASSSPRPAAARYSSSFTHRRARLSVGGGSKTEDDNNSSGKGSLTSSAAQPGSGVLAEGGTSSDSLHTDDDNISDFLKMLDQKKDLKSFQPGTAADIATRRTTAALSKFQRMRESHAVLSDSLSSSQMLHRSSTSSSRQLSSVPPMVAGTSMSISSSPGKPISPHTPHTPAIPSRLSANSIVEYSHRERSSGRHRTSGDGDAQPEENEDSEAARDLGTGAIDIPTSPRPFHPSYRRSSSVAQHRPLPSDEDVDILHYGLRSASLGGGEERQPLSLSGLLRLQEGSDVVVPAASRQAPPEEAATMERQGSSSVEGREDSRPSSARGLSYRLRVGGRGSGRGHTPPLGGSGFAAERVAGSGSSAEQRGGRFSFARPSSNFEEEEPLLFAMSDFGAIQNRDSRKSEDDGRGRSSAGTSERGGLSGDSGASSRRDSYRRGGGNTWT
ncbi:MAG: autophagy protein 13 [Icmadophila ericetorum]|nr:autophagy protein 13 [Icmadophila ericetorum]